jgi:hypothetical protein
MVTPTPAILDISAVPTAQVQWEGAVRIIRSLYPPIDLFEDIADPADWPLLISAEQKTNPRLMETIGNLDLVPPERRVSGPGASYLMAPFTHASVDRPSRFSDGHYGLLYIGSSFEVALRETVHHHANFMFATRQAAGWTSQFRELVVHVDARLHDLQTARFKPLLQPDSYGAAQAFGARLRASGSQGVLYPSIRCPAGRCVGLFYPDLASNIRQGRHLDYHWSGAAVDYVRDAGNGQVFRLG